MSQFPNLPSLSLDDEAVDTDEIIRSTSPRSGSPRLEPRSVSPDTASMRSMDTCCVEPEAVEMGKLNVQVQHAAHLVQRTTSMMGTNMTTYNMKSLPRGMALIIDIEVYENDVQERRLGSHVDVANLKDLFEQLSFDVYVHKNLTQSVFYKVITEFCTNKMHNEADMAIVAILSHGKDGIVYAADGMSIDMEFIYEYFNNRNCPALQGKPKFFIVQACRGDRPDQGVEDEDKRKSKGKKRRTSGLDRIPNLPEHRDVSRARPTWEDMIIAYSTIPGYASLRDHEKGTWFVQSLVEVFQNHSHNTELIDLLRMTSERLSHFTNEQGEKQTCNVEMRHLYKRIYFNPGQPAPQPRLVNMTRSLSTPPASPYNNQDLEWSQGHVKENSSYEETLQVNSIQGATTTPLHLPNSTKTVDLTATTTLHHRDQHDLTATTAVNCGSRQDGGDREKIDMAAFSVDPFFAQPPPSLPAKRISVKVGNKRIKLRMFKTRFKQKLKVTN